MTSPVETTSIGTPSIVARPLGRRIVVVLPYAPMGIFLAAGTAALGLSSMVVSDWAMHRAMLDELSAISDTVLLSLANFSLAPLITGLFVPESALLTISTEITGGDSEWRVMQKPELYPMADPLACANVMGYFEGEGLNWHFDRSEFTTTLLLQAPRQGGEFQYRQKLRSDEDPNYDGVARLLRDEDSEVSTLRLGAGDLNVFKGKNTAHRVTPPVGDRARVITVFTYYETPGRMFSDEENLGFYGRTNA